MPQKLPLDSPARGPVICMAVLNKKEKGAKKKNKKYTDRRNSELKERVSQRRHNAGGYTACQLAHLVL